MLTRRGYANVGFTGDLYIDESEKTILSMGTGSQPHLLWNIETGKFSRVPFSRVQFLGSTTELSPNGQYLGGFMGGLEKNKPVSLYVVFDVQSGERVMEVKAAGLYSCFSADSKSVAVSTPKGVELFDIATGERNLLLQHDQVNHMAFHENKILTSGADGFTKLWDASNGEEMVGLVSFRDHENTVVLPDGHYYSTSGAVGGIHYVIDNKAISFDQFDARFNRPDLVFKALQLDDPKLIDAYYRAYQKRLQKSGIDPEQFDNGFNIPTIRLEAHDLAATTEMEKVTLTIKASDPNYELSKLVVSINNVPIHGQAGIAVSGQSIDQTIEVTLTTGRNKISAYVENEKGTKSIEQSLETNLTVDQPSKLIAIAIGVSEYQDSPATTNLNYAAKDAEDFLNLIKQKGNYSEVVTKKFLNEEAVKANILGMRTLLESTHENDQVILFVASHGVLDSNYDYFLAMHDMQFNDPANGGLSYDALNDLMDGIPARKRLILIDACHSGEVDKDAITTQANTQKLPQGENLMFRGFEGLNVTSKVGLENSFELMKSTFKDLRRGTGAVVISAAGGLESAIEDTQWSTTGNGAFTYSIIEGVMSSNADLDENGTIQVSELKEYVSQKVRDLTGGVQNPTARQENLEFDFELIKRN